MRPLYFFQALLVRLDREGVDRRLALCLKEAVRRGDLPRKTDAQWLSQVLVNCWEGAALRSRMRRDPAPLRDMLDFYFRAASA